MVKKSIFLIVLILTLSVVFSLKFNLKQNTVLANEIEEISEQKIYCTATLEDDFVDNRIIVVLNKEESFRFRDYTPEDFAQIGCIDVRDLTYYTTKAIKDEFILQGSMNVAKAKVEEETLIKVEEYRTILSLTLDKKG